MNAFRSLSFKTSKKIMRDSHVTSTALPVNMPVIDFGNRQKFDLDDTTTNNGDDQDYSESSGTGGDMYPGSGLLYRDRKETKSTAFLHLDPSDTEFAEEDLADVHSFLQLMNKSKNMKNKLGKNNTSTTKLEPLHENDNSTELDHELPLQQKRVENKENTTSLQKQFQKHTTASSSSSTTSLSKPPIQKMRNLLASSYQPSVLALQAVQKQGKRSSSFTSSRETDQKQENQRRSFSEDSLKF